MEDTGGVEKSAPDNRGAFNAQAAVEFKPEN
jgi:hypothetical protein